MKRLLLSAAIAISLFSAVKADVKMPSLFTDGMVLQQNCKAAVWGFASPGEKITVSNTWNNDSQTVTAGNDGKWKVNIKTTSAGGPYALIIKGNNTIFINDVLLGEVWLASGQSNMEMPMEGWLPECPVKNGPQDIANSNNPKIRIFMVQRGVSFVPKDDLEGQWKQANPENTPKFGATCYYFAKKLNSELGIPVGIINTSWGGTPDESWIPEDFIKNVPEYTQTVKDINASKDKADEKEKWTLSRPHVERRDMPWEKIDLGDQKISDKAFDDNAWKTMTLPKSWENDVIKTFDGVVWFRKKINITPEMSGKELIISLGAIDDMDITYFNGKEIGKCMLDGFWQKERIYTVPAADVKTGEAVIAVRVLDTQGGGGICGNANSMKYYTKDNEKNAISLAGNWKFLPTAELKSNVFYKFNIDNQEFYQRPTLPAELGEMTATCLYNAMVAPIAGYNIAGAIWYQGEANVGRAEEYSRTFPIMINSWRNKWGIGDFPFYFVQIAPWDYGQGQSQEIREAQRLSLNVKNTGMAVTLDIGDNDNIHPADKITVGERLALWAFKDVYGKNNVCSGPLFKSQSINSNKITLTFDYADGLKAIGGTLKDFEIAGKDGKYYSATAEIKDGKVEVYSEKVKKPLSVRYLWKNTVDKPTLFNGAGLPASSFQSTRCWK